MKITAALVKEQGKTFTVLLVKRGIINSSNREDIRNSAPSNFPRPVILAEQKPDHRMIYHGQNEIVRFLSKYSFQALPWKEYRI